MAQRHAHAREQFRHAKGLGHIIVRAAIQRFHLIALVRARGNHHDGRLQHGAHKADQFHPIPIRQVQLQEHQIRAMGKQQQARLRQGLRVEHAIAARPQRGREQIADVPVLIHHQNALVHSAHPPSLPHFWRKKRKSCDTGRAQVSRRP